jgi:hypothetical protein
VRAIDAPETLYQKTIKHTGKEINTIAGYQLIPPDQEDSTFNEPLNAYASLMRRTQKSPTRLHKQSNLMPMLRRLKPIKLRPPSAAQRRSLPESKVRKAEGWLQFEFSRRAECTP